MQYLGLALQGKLETTTTCAVRGAADVAQGGEMGAEVRVSKMRVVSAKYILN